MLGLHNDGRPYTNSALRIAQIHQIALTNHVHNWTNIAENIFCDRMVTKLPCKPTTPYIIRDCSRIHLVSVYT